MEKGKYYLVSGYGVFNKAIVRAGDRYDDKRQVAYLGRCRILVWDNQVIREAKKGEKI